MKISMGQKNASEVVAEAIKSLPSKGGDIIFEKGVYHFYKQGTQKQYCAVSNNAFGIKNSAFILKNLENVTIDGNGSQFIFHGDISPFIVKDCKNVCLKNFSIDYEYPFHVEGIVRAAGENWVDLEIDEKIYPYFIEKGVMRMKTPDWESPEGVVSLITEFDPIRQSMALNHCFYCYKSGRFSGEEGTFECEKLKNGLVRVKMYMYAPPFLGNIMTFLFSNRECSAVFAENSKDLILKNVRIFCASGMGVICQTTENILLDSVIVTNNGTRYLSTEADATHFVNCSGSLRMKRCVLEYMDDDAVNMHGVYLKVTGGRGNTIDCMYEHGNISGFREGDELRLIHAVTLEETAQAQIVKVKNVDEKNIQLILDREVKVSDGMVAENLSRRFSSVHIWKCITGKNRPRALLVTTAGKVIIEDNLFYQANCGVEMAGDADFWFESGAAENVIIRNNVFRDCGHAYDVAAINICPHVGSSQAVYHKSVKIYGNKFLTFNPWIVSANNVGNLEIYDNMFLKTSNYPYIYHHKNIETEFCNVKQRNNLNFDN